MVCSDRGLKKGVIKAFSQLHPPRPGQVASAQHGACAQGLSGGAFGVTAWGPGPPLPLLCLMLRTSYFTRNLDSSAVKGNYSELG